MKIFLDSNIFIEHFKGNKNASSLLERVIGEELYINEVVYSEVAYIFIRTFSEKSYPDLKKNRELVSAAGKKFVELIYPALKLANFLEINREVVSISNNFIQKYGLLPNDALILATCKHYELDALASLDTDYEEACRNEGITLISDVENLR
ncbi:type II toxin-antitoxin system VapC family toxin [Archaeoglobus neptunius]|uniref:type II toxin-antitoxin system VapC family toxin n=1 Tax=Archaeoglobus neptunius TaxID=2798580 RepID=UPI001926F320|nr:type II toxin-antitoxin system VapC family toxin [Archaeoglobus neptunius]